MSGDGTIAKCMRRADGAYRSKEDKNGAQYYLHRLDGAAPAQPLPPPSPCGPAPNRADVDTLHRVYSGLLARLQLSGAHGDALRQRGLGDAEIDRRGYRTLAVRGRARLARTLREQLGDVVLSVPGFIVKVGEGDRPFVTLAGAAGLLVPVRDPAGRIVALLTRRDDASDGRGKYLYLSSLAVGGPGPGAPVHVPLGVTGPAEVVRVTEGALKSDLAHALSGLPTIGLAGVSTWRPALPMLRELGARIVRLAFDMDAQDKPTVARPLAALAEALAAEGFAVEMERWPAEHKGIDDALAVGAVVEVLTGEAARQAIADALTEATAGEPLPEPGPLGRLADVLAEGGAEALFRDAELLRALARLAEENAAEFMCIRTRLRAGLVRLTELDKVLAPLRQEIRRERPSLDAAGCYRVSAGRIVRDVQTRDGPVEVPLANWSGRIVEETVHDDGAERHITFTVEGALANGTPLPRAAVPADQFAFMRWPVGTWGTRAVVLAGPSTADHLRVALQLLSGNVPRRVVYGHTGWREIDGVWYYLHGAGAIGPEGQAKGVEVVLPDALSRFELPEPLEGAELVKAIRASLRLLDLGPNRITVPIFAAVYRAALGEADFSGCLTGPTGAFKTELAALAQQHYGPGMNSRHLPASWSSTGNALEGLAFVGKDTLLCVDDFAPTGSTADVQRMHREADRVLRSQGNRAGRQRMRADATLRSARPPRGLILSTGEDVPRGQSLRARLFIVELARGDITPANLTAAQRDAAAGLYAASMAGYLGWLASRYSAVCACLRQDHAKLRERAIADGGGQHARTPGIIADLALGVDHFLTFAVEAGALNPAERDALRRRCWLALIERAEAQTEHDEAAEPCGHFLRLLAGAIASGRAHIAGPDGSAPHTPEAWGWRAAGDIWTAQGRCIGWLTAEGLFLQPDAGYAEAQEMARQQGEALPLAARTLWRRLRERGVLATWDVGRQRNTVRRTLQGVEAREVLHLAADALSTCRRPSRPSSGPPETHETPDEWTEPVDGCSRNGRYRPPDRPPEPSTETGDNSANGQYGRSETGGRTPGPVPPPGARLIMVDGRRRQTTSIEDCCEWTWEGGSQWFLASEFPVPEGMGGRR